MKKLLVRVAWLYCLLVLGTTAILAAVEADEPTIEGRPISELIKQLEDSNRGIATRAARALANAEQKDQPKLVPILIPYLSSDRENTRAPVAQALGEYGPTARAAVPHLLPLLQGTQFERVRAAAAKALGQILKDAESSEEVEKVTQALTAKFNEDYDKYSDVRREAVRALGMIGPAAKSCIPKLTRALTDFKLHSDEHTMVRQQAAWTCGRMGPLAAEHIDRLISMLQQEGENMPETAEAIGKIGPVHENVVPNLMDKIERARYADSWAALKIAAFDALASFGPKSAPAVPLIKRLLPNIGNKSSFEDNVGIRISMLKALAAAGKEAAPAGAEIEAQLNPQIPSPKGMSKDDYEKRLNELREAAAVAYKAATGNEPPVAASRSKRGK
jgi:HEAT repeat protein